MNILIIGSGEIAKNGIQPLHSCTLVSYKECDVTKYDSVQRVIEQNKPNVVICTAGVSHVATVKESSIKDWKHEVDVNLIGSYHIAKASINNNVNTLIFMASVAGLYGKPNHSGYSASKAGVISLVQSLAKEGYDAYAISAGRVDTNMRDRDFPNEDKRTRLDPKEIGRVVSEILNHKHSPGDNIIIRKRGYRILRRVDKGSGWAQYLKVGEPPVV